MIQMASMKRHFVSYPKSGRSWIRYALSCAGVHHAIFFHHDSFEFNSPLMPEPSVDFGKRLSTYLSVDKVVYMYRDPRDILVSLYHQVTGRFRDFFGYDGTISDFIRDEYFGAKNLKIFQEQWLELCGLGVAYMVTYEQCHIDFGAVLLGILDYYQIEIERGLLREAVDASSFAKMRGREVSQDFPEPWLRPRNVFFKTRVGRPLNYHTSLNESDIDYLNSVFSLR